MKKYTFIITVFLLGLSMGCKKDDDKAPMEIALQNEPPLSFDLINVPDGAEDVDVTPTLSWESAKNPKGGEVTYDLYLGSEVNPTTLFESGIDGTSIKFVNKLHLLTDYYWKVVAKDSDGKTSQSAVHKFTTRNLNFPEEPVGDADSFPLLSRHTSLVYKDKLWIIGSSGSNDDNQVWSSENGKDWTLSTQNTMFSPRTGFTFTVFDNKLWVIGGYEEEDVDDDPMGKTDRQLKNYSKSSPDYKNDVWYSTDGSNWVAATLSAEFPKEYSTALWFLTTKFGL
ncbi:hypothetical protein [Maribacter halichondriae]|uniref:hypothetical protein n=1 Tax=Maribacter halichondriae TaxID=2980554 RepID=UPI002359CA7C|nr:hypothetical protein [Maribacter sp. Hal144]